MEKCDCWVVISNSDKAVCYGTKECEECTCNGDVSKCNFYPEKRKEKKTMNTAEMWLKAQEDGKTYYCGPLEYQKDFGLRYKETKNTLDRNIWISLNHFMKERWYSCPAMTKSEAEARFNIKIVGE